MDELVALGKPVPDVPELQSIAIQVRVDIDPKLRAQLNPDQTVFVFAKPVGGRMPLAAVKLTVGELPKQITLDDSLAMTAQAKLSMHPEITVGARISMSGQPQASQGDLQSSELQVIVKDTKEPLTLMIDQIVQ
jgi:cytochrome c-type biogenesis protein CcmH